MLKKRGVSRKCVCFCGMGPLESYVKSIDIIYTRIYISYYRYLAVPTERPISSAGTS